MNNKISIMITAGVMALAAVSCSETSDAPVTGATGTLSLKSMGVSVDTSTEVHSRAGEIDLNPFLVTIVPVSGEGTPTTYTYGTMPEVLTLPLGDYRVDVESHRVEKAAWDAPYYKGSSAVFKIEDNKVTEIGVISCKFASLKVTVAYTDQLKALLGSDVTVNVEANDEGSLIYTPEETRAGYFEVIEGSTTLAATFAGTVDGAYSTNVKTFTGVKPGVHYILTYSVKAGPTPPDQTGSVNPGIEIDSQLSEENVTGSVDPGDDPLLPDGDRPGQKPDTPTPPDVPNPPVGEETISFLNPDGSDFDSAKTYTASTWTGDFIVNIKADDGIAHLLVKIDSDGLTKDFLQSVMLDDEFDLAYPGDLSEGLGGLGFPIGDQVVNQTSVDFNITQFIPMIPIVPGGITYANFIITVTDNKGIQKAMTLKFVP